MKTVEQRIAERLHELNVRRLQLIDYLKMKVATEEDWHAVADAAMDLRDLDAEGLGLQNILVGNVIENS